MSLCFPREEKDIYTHVYNIYNIKSAQATVKKIHCTCLFPTNP